MGAEENKAIERRVAEELNKGNVGVIDEFFAPDWVYHIAGMEPMGREAFKQLMKMVYSAFPDFHMAAEDMIAEGDKVVTRWTNSGTHQGEFMGIPPTGRQMSYASTLMVRFVDGKEVYAWEVMDRLTMLQQLGVVPLMDQAT